MTQSLVKTNIILYSLVETVPIYKNLSLLLFKLLKSKNDCTSSTRLFHRRPFCIVVLLTSDGFHHHYPFGKGKVSC